MDKPMTATEILLNKLGLIDVVPVGRREFKAVLSKVIEAFEKIRGKQGRSQLKKNLKAFYRQAVVQ